MIYDSLQGLINLMTGKQSMIPFSTSASETMDPMQVIKTRRGQITTYMTTSALRRELRRRCQVSSESVNQYSKLELKELLRLT